MKKFFLLTGLLTFVAICAVGGSHTSGLVQHLLFIAPAILVMKVACGKESSKTNNTVPVIQPETYTVSRQLNPEAEEKAIANA